jgi:hypothetical protein
LRRSVSFITLNGDFCIELVDLPINYSDRLSNLAYFAWGLALFVTTCTLDIIVHHPVCAIVNP